MMTYNKNNPSTIQEMFNSIAKRYDRANAVLSLGMHHRWNSALVSQLNFSSTSKTYLDLCSGTGDIAFQAMHRNPHLEQVYMLDFSEEMLNQAKNKEQRLRTHSPPPAITYIHGDAQAIPLANNTVDHVSIAYGIRNVQSSTQCIQESFRVLRPGGVFGILELTKPRHALLRAGHSFYLKTCLPLLGKLIASNEEAYQYLNRSIRQFVEPDVLQRQMEEAGFSDCQQIRLLGGVATVLVGYKGND